MRVLTGTSPCRPAHNPPILHSVLAQNLQFQFLVKATSLRAWRAHGEEDHPKDFGTWFQECTGGPPTPHILPFRSTTFLNILAQNLVTNLIISLCFVIVLSDCQRPVPEQSAHSSGRQVRGHLLPEHFLSFIVLF